MLANIRVKDLVLIDELDLEFNAGFNVITGETGAGKSLIAGAVDLLLGRRARGESVRRGCKEAEVEGLFDISDEPEVKSRLTDAGLPAEDDELLIRRVIPASGRNRCYINGRLASLGVLSHVAAGIARVMSQHEQHSLLDSGKQLEMLDGFGKLEPLVLKMNALHGETQKAQDVLLELQGREKDRAGRLDYLNFQLSEIDTLAPVSGELEQIEQEIDKMRHQEQLISAAARSCSELYDNDQSIFDRLGSLTNLLEDAANHDDTLEESSRQLSEACALVEDVSRFLSGYGRNMESDPEALAGLEERREQLRNLVRKHNTNLDGVIAMRDEIAEEIDTLSRYEDAIEQARESVSKNRAHAAKHALELSRARHKTAKKLSKAVTAELKDLQFVQAQFEVQIDSAEVGATGLDATEFLVALNPGEGAHPLRKVASGGELSRLMLAVKRALAGVGPVGTYVFDEVDSGIGGPVAAAVGKKLAQVASFHQVICITHLPQIAGMADAHFMVFKKASNGRTATRITRLDEEQRVDETARMLGGEKVTSKTREAARELIVAESA